MRAGTRLFALFSILAVLGGYYSFLLVTKKVPCVTPITYQVVELDPRFNLSEEEVEADIKQAAQVWNDVIGVDVLIEGGKPELPIYFVYETTQRANDTIESVNSEVDRLKEEQTQVGNQYAELKKQNSNSAELKALLKKYYSLRDQINAAIALGRNAVPQGDITEGRYIYDDAGQRMYIYGFQSKEQLFRALEHEFGHALGLEHVGGEDSIMYPINTSKNLELTAEDKAELARACSGE